MTKEELVDEFKSTLGEDFDIDNTELQLICSSPFRFLKERIMEGTLKDVKFKYLGKFEVNIPMIKYSKKTLEEKFKSGEVTEERYLKRMKILNQVDEN